MYCFLVECVNWLTDLIVSSKGNGVIDCLVKWLIGVVG